MTISLGQKRITGLVILFLVVMPVHREQESSAQLPRSRAITGHQRPPAPIDMTRVMNSRFGRSTPQEPPLEQKAPEKSSPNPWKPKVKERRWKYIVLHHTATSQGSVASIHRAHSQRLDSRGKPWRGIGYHFVIGNGHGMEDGRIEQTFRWVDQIEGAHAGNANYNNWGIGICLVGNFDKTKPTPRQLDALTTLLIALKENYGIDSKHVLAHKTVKSTHCPGRYFPLHLFSQAQNPCGIHYHYRYRWR